MAKNKEFKAEYLKDLDTRPFEPEDIAWISSPQLKQDIAIQT